MDLGMNVMKHSTTDLRMLFLLRFDFINSILNKKQNQCTLCYNKTAMTESFKTKKIVELKDLG